MAETTPGLDLAIYQKLDGIGSCTFDELVRRLSTYFLGATVFSGGSAQPARNPLGPPRARRRLCSIQIGPAVRRS